MDTFCGWMKEIRWNYEISEQEKWMDNISHDSAVWRREMPKKGKIKKRSFLYSAVSGPLNRSKRFTLFHSLADMIIPTPTRHLREAF